MTRTVFVGRQPLADQLASLPAFGEILRCGGLRSVHEVWPADLLVLDLEGLDATDRGLLSDWRPPTEKLIVGSSLSDKTLFAQVLRTGWARHFAAIAQQSFVDDVSLTARFLLEAESPQWGRYLRAEWEQWEEVNDSASRTRIRAVARRCAAASGVSARVLAAYTSVVDELLTNALYDAPAVAQGERGSAARSRDPSYQLEEGKVVRVALGGNQRQLGVCVTDPYGSLVPEVALGYIARGLERERVRPGRTSSGGAGLGLLLTFQSVSRLVLHVTPGRCTHAIALFNLEREHRRRSSRSLDVFVAANDRMMTREP